MFFLVICSGIELQGCRQVIVTAIYPTNLPFLHVSNGYSKSSNVVSSSIARQVLSHRICLTACTLPTNPGKEDGAPRDSPNPQADAAESVHTGAGSAFCPTPHLYSSVRVAPPGFCLVDCP